MLKKKLADEENQAWTMAEKGRKSWTKQEKEAFLKSPEIKALLNKININKENFFKALRELIYNVVNSDFNHFDVELEIIKNKLAKGEELADYDLAILLMNKELKDWSEWENFLYEELPQVREYFIDLFVQKLAALGKQNWSVEEKKFLLKHPEVRQYYEKFLQRLPENQKIGEKHARELFKKLMLKDISKEE